MPCKPFRSFHLAKQITPILASLAIISVLFACDSTSTPTSGHSAGDETTSSTEDNDQPHEPLQFEWQGVQVPEDLASARWNGEFVTTAVNLPLFEGAPGLASSDEFSAAAHLYLTSDGMHLGNAARLERIFINHGDAETEASMRELTDDESLPIINTTIDLPLVDASWSSVLAQPILELRQTEEALHDAGISRFGPEEQTSLLLYVDERVPYDAFANLLETLGDLGIERFGLALGSDAEHRVVELRRPNFCAPTRPDPDGDSCYAVNLFVDDFDLFASLHPEAEPHCMRDDLHAADAIQLHGSEQSCPALAAATPGSIDREGLYSLLANVRSAGPLCPALTLRAQPIWTMGDLGPVLAALSNLHETALVLAPPRSDDDALHQNTLSCRNARDTSDLTDPEMAVNDIHHRMEARRTEYAGEWLFEGLAESIDLDSLGGGGFDDLFTGSLDEALMGSLIGDSDAMGIEIGAGSVGLRGSGGGEGYGYVGGLGQISSSRRGTLETDSNNSAEGGLEFSLVDAAIQSRHSRLIDCFENERRQNPDIAGRVVATWEIEADGSVSGSVLLSENTVGNAEVDGCLRREIRGVDFPPSPSNDSTTVKYSIIYAAP